MSRNVRKCISRCEQQRLYSAGAFCAAAKDHLQVNKIVYNNNKIIVIMIVNLNLHLIQIFIILITINTYGHGHNTSCIVASAPSEDSD